MNLFSLNFNSLYHYCIRMSIFYAKIIFLCVHILKTTQKVPAHKLACISIYAYCILAYSLQNANKVVY